MGDILLAESKGITKMYLFVSRRYFGYPHPGFSDAGG